jgi:hypothetical protein
LERKYIKNTALLFFSAIGFMWCIWQREIMALPYLTEQWHTIYQGVVWGVVYDFSYLSQAAGLIIALASIWFWTEPHTKNEIVLRCSILLFVCSVGVHEFLLSPLMSLNWNKKFNFFWGIWIPWGLATFLVLALEIICFVSALASIWYWED